MFLSTATGEWSSPAVTGTKPPPFSRFSFTKVDSSRAVVYGGRTDRGLKSDAYVLELDKWVRGICYSFTWLLNRYGDHTIVG